MKQAKVLVFSLLILASLCFGPMVHGARMVSFDEAWSRAKVVVRGQLVQAYWLKAPKAPSKRGQIVYLVKVNQVWKGTSNSWIRITEKVDPNVEGCVALRPRSVERKQHYFYIRPRADGLYESAAWGSCGLARIASPKARKHLMKKKTTGPRSPQKVNRPSLPQKALLPNTSNTPEGFKKKSSSSKGSSFLGCSCQSVGAATNGKKEDPSSPIGPLVLFALSVFLMIRARHT